VFYKQWGVVRVEGTVSGLGTTGVASKEGGGVPEGGRKRIQGDYWIQVMS